MDPVQKDQNCFGEDLRELPKVPPFTLSYFISWFHKFKNTQEFLTRSQWFNKLMGNSQVIKLILEGKEEAEIRKSWSEELSAYGAIRQKYLLYPDFRTIK